MVMNIATVASSLKAQQIGLEVGARMMGMAKDMAEDPRCHVEVDGIGQAMELAVHPHLGSNLDVSG